MSSMTRGAMQAPGAPGGLGRGRWAGVALVWVGALLGWVLPVWASALAQEPAAPQPREVFSPNRDFFVRVIPGAGMAGLMAGSAAPMAQQPFAQAEFYHRAEDRSYRLVAQASLANAIAPAEFLVSNEGHLVTVDNWRAEGLGKVVALYAANGSLLRGFELADLFDAEEIASLARPGPLVRWRDGPAYIGLQPLTLIVGARNGGEFVFGLESGQFKYCESRRQATRCRMGNLPRQWVVNGSIALER